MTNTIPFAVQPGPLPTVYHSYHADENHYDEGRTKPIQYGVLHNTEGDDSREWLSTYPGSGVSIHVLVDRAGVRWNIVDYNDTAWHVGNAKSPYSNSNCLGLEFENRSNAWGTHEPYTEAQLNTAAHCIATWEFSYGIPWNCIVRHGDIALPYGRRYDPSNFDLDAFYARVDDWYGFFQSLPESEHHIYIV